jgi:toxin YoeB
MSKITFTEPAWEENLSWQSEDKKTWKSINELIKAIQRNPFRGIGKPEPLKGELTGKWSRRINKKDRLLYEVTNDMIVIIQCKGHYADN